MNPQIRGRANRERHTPCRWRLLPNPIQSGSTPTPLASTSARTKVLLMRQRQPATRFVLALSWLAITSAACESSQLRADPKALAAASPELLDRVRADPYNYYRLINHEWTARVCETFAADVPNQPIVQLHGDAHVEQYALTNDAWGLDDFDDSARGPALVDIVRFLGSIDLAARRRGWTADRDLLFDRFFAGYRRGLTEPFYQPAQPDIVRRLRAEAHTPTREAFLAWAETQMTPMSETTMKDIAAAMEVFAQVVHRERPDLPDGYFRISRSGWLHMGVGSAASLKILMRVNGPSSDPADDELLEAKAVRGLGGLGCLEAPKSQPTLRVIAGNQQLGRLKHNILAAGPEIAVSEMAIEGEQLRNWWIRSWEPSYREIGLDDLRSVEDLSDIVYDSGVQLAAGSIHAASAAEATIIRTRSLASIAALETRLRKEAEILVQELVQGWRELGGR
jgi:hypothetical protein